MATVVVSPFNVANFPEGGGHFWAYMQYVQGLRRLGCEVYWLENFRSSSEDGRDRGVQGAFLERMERYGLAGKVILYESRDISSTAGPYEYIGFEQPEAEAIFRRADLLLNFHYGIDAPLLSYFRRTALVDIDPGLLQIWMSTGQLVVPPHDVYFTIGETVGTPSVSFPDCGLTWHHIRPPVCLELWPYVYDPSAKSFTTVSSWWSGAHGGEYIFIDGEFHDNNKRASFQQFIDLPRRSGQRLEIALFLAPEDDEDRQALESHGWRVRHALEVAATPELYRSYIQRSRGEIGVAKPFYARLHTAWVSDRTVCYLASGKPAVVQDTGPSSFLPSGRGIFRFSSVEEAARALDSIDADYETHCRAAREIAETFFDARRTLERILDIALIR